LAVLPARVRLRGRLEASLRGQLRFEQFTKRSLVNAFNSTRWPPFARRKAIYSADALSCTFESGVRLEVHREATLSIGKGTYLNRNVHIVVAESESIGKFVKVA
jgi:hypothetical protein